MFFLHFVIILCLFPVKQNCCRFLHFSYQAEAFNGYYDKLCTIKWDDFCLSITLRVIFNDTQRERLVFHSIHDRNGWSAACDLFYMFTQALSCIHLIISTDV